MVRKNIILSVFLLLLLVFVGSNFVLSEEVGCCVISKAGDKCLNGYPESSCISDFFKGGQDCSQVNSCQRGCCKDSCTEVFSYECAFGFDSTVDSCNEVDECVANCFYLSSNNCVGELVPCYGSFFDCNQKFPSPAYEVCETDFDKNYIDCYNNVPVGSQRYNISGKVTDSSNSALMNARVYLTSGLSVDTDLNGEYKLINAPVGKYDVFVTKKGYFDDSKEVNVVSQNLNNVDFTLNPSDEIILSGYVKQSSTPMPGVTLKLTNRDDSQITYFFVTDDYGYFESDDMEAGSYVPKIYDLSGNVQDASPSIFEVSSSMMQNFSYSVSGDDVDTSVSYTITGNVNASDGSDSSGARVILMNKITGDVVDSTFVSNEYYTISTNPGNYYLYVSKDGYLSQTSVSFYLGENSEFNFTLLKTREQTVDAGNKGNLTVYVKGCDEQSCTSKYDLEGADVFLFLVETSGDDEVRYAYNLPKKTDVNGKVVFEDISVNLEDGQNYYIEVKRLNYNCGVCDASIDSDDFVNNRAEVGEDEEIYLVKKPLYKVSGKLTDCDTSEPISDFLFYIPEIGKKSAQNTGFLGEFEIKDIPSGEYSLHVADKRGEGVLPYETKTFSITVGSEDLSSQNFCLEQLTCSANTISKESYFVPNIGSEITHNGISNQKISFSFSATLAENPSGCSLNRSTILYCMDDDCSFTYEGEDYVIDEDFDDIENLEKNPILLNLAFRDDASLDFSDPTFDDQTTVGDDDIAILAERKYCFVVAQTYNTSDEQYVTRLSAVRCKYSGIEPCLKEFEEFCFSDETEYGVDYTYMLDDANYIGTCNKEDGYYGEKFIQCEQGKKCFFDGEEATCKNPNLCEECSGSFAVFTFQPYYTDDEQSKSCSKLGNFCFIDRNYDDLNFISNADVYKSCNMISSCYDYKSESVCNSNPCFSGNELMDCQWNSSSFNEFGDGVCVPVQEEYQDCSLCHDPKNRFFGVCDQNRCDLFGDCYFRYTPVSSIDIKDDDGKILGLRRDLDINYRCVSANEVSCEDYNNYTDCVAYSGLENQSLIEPFYLDSDYYTGKFNGLRNNSRINKSNDKYSLGNCRWITTDDYNYNSIQNFQYYNFSDGNNEGICIKNSDYSVITDSYHSDSYGDLLTHYGSDCKGWKDIWQWQFFIRNPGEGSDANSLLWHACSLDNEAGNSSLMKITPKPKVSGNPNLQLVFAVDDDYLEYFRTKLNGYENTNKYELNALLVNSSKLTDIWGEDSGEGKGYFAKNSNFIGGNKIIVDFGSVVSGQYDLYYFLRDASNNLELLQKEEIEVVSDGPGVKIDWSFESKEDLTNNPHVKKYLSDLTISTGADNSESEITCYSEFTDESGQVLFVDLNPIKGVEGSKANNWSVMFPDLKDGIYYYKIQCKNDLDFYTPEFRINYDGENGYEEIVDTNNWAQIEIEINSDRNLRLEPKILTVSENSGSKNLIAYTAVPSECKIFKAPEAQVVNPSFAGGFDHYDEDTFNSWGDSSNSDWELTEPKTFSKSNPPLTMNYAHLFKINTDDLRKDETHNYYIWCEHTLSNDEIIYSEINEINKFSVYVDSQEPQVYVSSFSMNPVNIDNLNEVWFNSNSYESSLIRCIDRGSSGNEFGRDNENENLSICFGETCAQGKNLYSLRNNFNFETSFDFDYSCYDSYDTGNLLEGQARINIDDEQPKIRSFELLSGNLQGQIKKNVCGHPVLPAPKEGSSTKYITIGIDIDDSVVSDISDLENYVFENFNLTTSLYFSTGQSDYATINFRETQTGKYSLKFAVDGIKLYRDDDLIYELSSEQLDSKFNQSDFLIDKWHDILLKVNGNKINLSVDDKVLIFEQESTYLSGKIGVEKQGFEFDTDNFRIISYLMSSPLDLDRSVYRVGNGLTKKGLVQDPDSVSKIFLALSSDELEKDEVNSLFFKIMDQAGEFASYGFDLKNFDVVLDSKVPILKPKKVYTTENTDDFGTPSYEIVTDHKKDKKDYILAEYDLETYIDFDFYDPLNTNSECAGAGVDDLNTKVFVSQDKNEYVPFDSDDIIYNESTKTLTLDITDLTEKSGTKFIRVNVTDKVGNYKIYNYVLKINDSMGPRFKLNLTTRYVEYELSHEDTTELLGAGTYGFCLNTHSDDVDEDTFVINPKLPYLALINFDKESMCGNLSVVSGTKYSREQRPLPFEIKVHDAQGTQGGITVNLKIDTLQPPVAELVPPFEEYLSGQIDGNIYFDDTYPVKSIRYPERQNDFVYVYTNVTNMIVTGFAPKNSYLKYNDAKGVNDLHDYTVNNEPVEVEGVPFNLSRDAEINSTEIYVYGEWANMLRSLVETNEGEIYIKFEADENEYYNRKYPDYGKYYLISNVSEWENSNDKLFDETKITLVNGLDYEFKTGDLYELYRQEELNQLFRLNLSLNSNDETVFYIKSLNDLQTENYMKPLYKIVNDNVSPMIVRNSVFPPVGTFNKKETDLSFNVTEKVSGISREGINLYLNGEQVDSSRIYVQDNKPNFKVIYDPKEHLVDGDYAVQIQVTDRSGNSDYYEYNFTMASGAPNYPIITIDDEVYNNNKGMIWVKHHDLNVEVYFDDVLNVSLVGIKRANLDASSFTTDLEIYNVSRNKFGFTTQLHDINDGYVYDFWYDIEAYRTFNDGNVSPVGKYRLQIIYDMVPPNVRLLDKGIVRRFRPDSIYDILMDVDNEMYDLRVKVDAPLTWQNRTETYLIKVGNNELVGIGENQVNVEFLGFDLNTMQRIGLLDGDIDREYLAEFDYLSEFETIKSNESNDNLGTVDFTPSLAVDATGVGNSLKEYFIDNQISNAPVAVLRVDGITMPVGLGENAFGNYELFIDDIFVSFDGQNKGAVKFHVDNSVANKTVSREFWSRAIQNLGGSHLLYSGDYILPQLSEDRLIPLDLVISDVAGNEFRDSLTIVVDTIPPQFEVINVTMIDTETNSSQVLTKESYDQLSYWTNDKIVRILARMITPDIVSVKAENQMLDMIYDGVIDENTQTFYVDVELKGEYQKEELNNIILNVTDEVGYSDVSGLFVERDLLAPELRNVDVEMR